MALDVKSFVLGFAAALVVLSLGPLGFYGAVLLLLISLLVWIRGAVRQSRSPPPRINCRNCGAPNPPERHACNYCDESLTDSDS